MTEQIDIKLDEKIDITIREPKKYKVIFLNDDVTPIDFVVSVIVELFKHSHETAVAVTMQIHEEGSGVVGVYAYEIAEQKSIEVINVCRDHGYPLKVKIEEEE
jgi:ATP-dependent Clp protease adaptor protein ClpS